MLRGMSVYPLQERISELCSRVVSTSDPEEFMQVGSELRAALRAQLAYLRDMLDEAKRTIAQLPSPSPSERRKNERRKTERRKARQDQQEFCPPKRRHQRNQFDPSDGRKAAEAKAPRLFTRQFGRAWERHVVAVGQIYSLPEALTPFGLGDPVSSLASA